MQQMHNLFYIPPEKITSKEIVINGEAFHHLKNVLRKKVGATVVISDGAGSVFTTEIISITRSHMTTQIVDKKIVAHRRSLRCALAFVPIKGARNDYILEKGTELGIDCFVPFISERSVVQRIRHSRLQRFERVAISAMLQSQQYFLPAIQPLANSAALADIFLQYDRVFVAHPDGPRAVDRSAGSVLLVIGPEGGFDEHEVSLFTDRGARLLSLGIHRLRSETAAIVGVTKILTAYSEL